MPTKRQVLDLLSRDELADLADRRALTVPDRRSKARIAEALEADGPSLSELLADFSRARLKELCRALDLDDGGREKALLLMRLVSEEGVPAAGSGAGRRGATSPSSSSATTNGSGLATSGRSPSLPVEQLDLALGRKLTPAELQRELWSAADILRGSIDSSDYKNYIFGLVFLKRISDRFDEECEALVAEGANPEDRDEHQFFVPKRARWAFLQKVATNIGEALNTACHALEDANRSLEGVLAGTDFNDERRLGDAKNRDTVLARLIQHFSKLRLRNDALSEPDMLGNAYEYLVEKFADDSGKKGGEFRTPEKVVDLVVELLAPKEGMRICDPTCGSGGMLLGCAQYVARHGGNARNLSLFGQEKNLSTWAICKMNMLLHGRLDDRIEKGDTIRDPKLLEGGRLMVFDRVLANPPFSLDEWGRTEAEKDGFRRFIYGIPPKAKGDMAFLQHMVATLNDRGQVGVVMPHGVLFRGSSEGEIRKRILQDDLFDAIIGLPPNLFFGTGIPAAILVLRKTKTAERRRRVMFIDASREFQEGSSRNYLRDQDVQKIADTFHAFKDVERYARVVEIQEIEKSEFSLNISRYIITNEAEERVDLAGALAKLKKLRKARAESEAKVDELLTELGYGSN
jgi:type I restriction enzyme M protein